jgi:hypothetical protein
MQRVQHHETNGATTFDLPRFYYKGKDSLTTLLLSALLELEANEGMLLKMSCFQKALHHQTIGATTLDLL